MHAVLPPQLSIPYTGALLGAGAAASRAETFRTWSGSGSKGFTCACARCAAYRAQPAVLKAEEEACAALEELLNPTEDVAWGWPKPPGPPKPADKVMGAKKRQARLALLRAEATPAVARAGLAPLLMLEAWALARKRDFPAAAAAAAEAASLLEAIFGPLSDPSGVLTQTRLDAALFALAAGRETEARALAGRALRPSSSSSGNCWNVWVKDADSFREMAEERARKFGELWSGGAGPDPAAPAAKGRRAAPRKKKADATAAEGEQQQPPEQASPAAAQAEPAWTREPDAWGEKLGGLIRAEAAAAAEAAAEAAAGAADAPKQ